MSIIALAVLSTGHLLIQLKKLPKKRQVWNNYPPPCQQSVRVTKESTEATVAFVRCNFKVSIYSCCSVR